ncbi:MAG: tRNA (adenosine(37)-N6)-threonylcarbamoyltransferase complex transferase subunit TsaD [Desulfopila sp.]|jgi:N6-L-threonylcarbamoyladenine synthase|nr:tRNA (adenosine(37)-N6)-threonylcarbamoyltransferase complex transferase subunit TsaD [Desulfopila sp.]
MLILGIETSCDDTAAAVLQDDYRILSNVVSSQDGIHARFGGVVPELASRKHLESINPVVEEALYRANTSLRNIDLIAVTQGPGLIGSLLVGFCYGKALASVSKTPYVGVDHMTGHLLSIFLERDTPAFPYVALIVSGGTTALFLCRGYTDFTLIGRTRDDAAGEAFDKVAKVLDLGYPGGPLVSRAASNGEITAFRFPRAWLDNSSLDFSFSGLKTAVFNTYQSCLKAGHVPVADICASFEEAVTEVLVEKTIRAANQQMVGTIVLGGGVSANLHLRNKITQRCHQDNLKLFLPQLQYCTDNAAMIALAGYYSYQETSQSLPFDADVFSRSRLG